MTSPLRVVHIIQSYYPRLGGAETQLRSLARCWQIQGLDLAILTRRYPGMQSFELIDGVPVYRLPIPGSKASASLTFTLSALWRIRQLRPDIIHAHELLSPTTTALAARRLFQIPVVVKVLRGGVLGDVDKLNHRKSGRRRIELMKKEVDAFVVISREINQELADVGVPDHKRVFIPNGVDVEHFMPATDEQKYAARETLGISEGPVGVYSGRFVAEKRIDELVDAWTAVCKCYPNARLMLLGDGSEMDHLITRNTPGIHFAGRVEDVRPYLRAADIFILPSATEGLSNSLLEAMAMGLPCVVTDVGGAADLVENGRNGVLIRPTGVEQIEQGVLQLFSMGEARKILGEEARKKVLKEYSLERVAQELRDLYAELKGYHLQNTPTTTKSESVH